MVRWKDSRLFLSHTLRGETVGLEEIDDGVWSLFYGPVLLARFDEPERRFYGCSPYRAIEHPTSRSIAIPVRLESASTLARRRSFRACPRLSRCHQPSQSVTYVPGLFCYPCS